MPPGADGLRSVVSTNKLTLEESWHPEPKSAKVGDAFTRTITLTGADTPGMALPEIAEADIPGLSIYRRSPQIDDQSNSDGLTGRRIETISYLCERGGHYTIPARTLTCGIWMTRRCGRNT